MPSSVAMDFTHRISPSVLPELMDGECSYEEFYACLRSLEQVNRWLLGYRPTLAWLKHLPRSQSEPMRILDVGSGGGDLLRQIATWARQRGIAVELTGIDLNPHAARAAAESTPQQIGIRWVTGNALTYQADRPVDVIVSSLMTHHLEDKQIVTMLRWMDATARVSWFINDLERSEMAARLFGWLARFVGWHRFVRHDGPVSFRRAFREEDWLRLLEAADISPQTVTLKHWQPGRLCVGRRK